MFIYFNNNPKGDKIGDCVVRAMSLALDIDYNIIGDMLLKNSKRNNCHIISIDCYSKILEDEFKLKRFRSNKITVGALSKIFSKNTLLIRIKNHLTCSINGDIYDIWNPEKEKVDCFWVVN
ncbi:MAG: hypothetical protein IKP50_03905 [Bacilli bacterium]|nr:hypothetical protein [Bacilli bacterium]